jgi:hypothetical protein
MTDAHDPILPAAPARTPPRFVPTLTTVLDDAPSSLDLDLSGMPRAAAPAPCAGKALDAEAPRDADDEVDALERRLLSRVMARVDPLLEQRLSDAVAATVEAQLDLMVPRLRRDMQAALRALISEALARELVENPNAHRP